MAWLKKNLLLVVSGVVALGLLGFAGFYLWSKYSLESQVTESLAGQTKELEDYYKKEPNPGNEKVDNIKAAKEQDKKLSEFAEESRKTFAQLSYPTNLDSGGLNLLLNVSIDELQRSADKAGVKLPPQYGFSFGQARTKMSFDQKEILPLARMMLDVKTICNELFQSRILVLDGIRRSAASSFDTVQSSGVSEFWNKKPTTNDWAIPTPYEFTFHCFTSELAAVLETLYRSPYGFLIKNVVVDTSASQYLDKAADSTAEPAAPMMPNMNMAQLSMMMRYGRRYAPAAPPPQEVPAAAATAKGGLTPWLDEKPFRAILWIEVVRLRDPNEAKSAKPARSAGRGARGAEGQPADGGAPAGDAQSQPAAETAPAQ